MISKKKIFNILIILVVVVLLGMVATVPSLSFYYKKGDDYTMKVVDPIKRFVFSGKTSEDENKKANTHTITLTPGYYYVAAWGGDGSGQSTRVRHYSASGSNGKAATVNKGNDGKEQTGWLRVTTQTTFTVEVGGSGYFDFTDANDKVGTGHGGFGGLLGAGGNGGTGGINRNNRNDGSNGSSGGGGGGASGIYISPNTGSTLSTYLVAGGGGGAGGLSGSNNVNDYDLLATTSSGNTTTAKGANGTNGSYNSSGFSGAFGFGAGGGAGGGYQRGGAGGNAGSSSEYKGSRGGYGQSGTTATLSTSQLNGNTIGFLSSDQVRSLSLIKPIINRIPQTIPTGTIKGLDGEVVICFVRSL
ncbi:MAG: hypothetical protein LBM02_06070 [Lachnospiraceae bacterium]|jgi:hypothetical protein|nr:hypothetical protein [Lachnospiraceae bacterium]